MTTSKEKIGELKMLSEAIRRDTIASQEAARRGERARIVAWLRRDDPSADNCYERGVADWIEGGAVEEWERLGRPQGDANP